MPRTRISSFQPGRKRSRRRHWAIPTLYWAWKKEIGEREDGKTRWTKRRYSAAAWRNPW
jgi:hypothetical protein